MTAGLSVRPATAGDEEFLFAVYASTRTAELAALSWNDAETQAFLRMQHAAQQAGYRARHPDADFLVVERHGKPLGRLLLARMDGELRVLDIALLPEARGAGVGSALLADVLADADADGLRVSLHVDPDNPALRLYTRLGFHPDGRSDVHVLLVREPATVS